MTVPRKYLKNIWEIIEKYRESPRQKALEKYMDSNKNHQHSTSKAQRKVLNYFFKNCKKLFLKHQESIMKVVEKCQESTRKNCSVL